MILPSRVCYFVPDYQNRTHQQARQIGPSVILPVKYCKTVKRTQICSGKGLTFYLTHLTLIHRKGKVPVDNESFTLRNKPKVQRTLCQFFFKKIVFTGCQMPLWLKACFWMNLLESAYMQLCNVIVCSQYVLNLLLLFFSRHYSEEDLPERPPPPSEKDNMPFSGQY